MSSNETIFKDGKAEPCLTCRDASTETKVGELDDLDLDSLTKEKAE